MAGDANLWPKTSRFPLKKKLLPTCDPSMWLTHILVKWVKWKFLDFRIGQKRCSSDGRRRDVWSSVGAAASFQMPPDCSITDCITECVGGNQAGNEWFVRPERSEAYSQTLIEKKKNFPFWVSSDFLKTGTAHFCLCSASRPLNYINGGWDGSPIYLGAPQPLWSKLIGNSKAPLSCALQKRGKKTPWRSCFWE